jgi:hypothetical protein
MQVLNSLTGMPQRFRAAMREKFFKPQKNNSGSNEFSAGLVAPSPSAGCQQDHFMVSLPAK